MHITSLTAENVKRLRAVTITPDGNVVTLCGRNEQGKSSVLDAIYYALAGKKAMPSKPVRRGATSAIVKLTLGDLRITRTIAPDGVTKVVVESAEGARYPTPQAMLDAITGELAFDPLAFAEEAPKQQLEVLRRLVKLDVDVDALRVANERDYTLRTDFNRRARSFEERVKTASEGVDWSIDVTPTDVSALVEQVSKAFEHNSAVAKETDRRTQLRHSLETRRASAAMKRDQAKRLLMEAAELEKAIESDTIDLHNAGPVPDLIDVTALRHKIDEAQKENARKEMQVRQREALAAAKQELNSTLTESTRLSDAITARTQQVTDAIGNATMPIPGLSFGDGEVLYNGIPLDQASQAERIRVSFAVAMAANPKLKVVFIRDGSLLDESNLALVAEMAEEHGYQVWIEKVDSSGKVGIVLEDGAVTAIDGVPVGAEQDITEGATVGA